MFLPTVPSSPKNTPPPVAPLDRDLQKSPVLMLQDSPPAGDGLALAWPVDRTENEVAITPALPRPDSIASQGPDSTSNVYHQARAVVFESPSGEQTVCLQNMLCYTVPQKSRNELPARQMGSSGKNTTFAESVVLPHECGTIGRTRIGSSPLWDGVRKTSPLANTTPLTVTATRLSDSPKSNTTDQEYDNIKEESTESDLRLRHKQLRSPKALLKEDGGKPGRSLITSDRYQGILEQDHPEEALSRGLLGSCYCSLVAAVLALTLFVVCLAFCYGPSILATMLGGTGNQCVTLNVSNLRNELKMNLIGQPVALRFIVDAVEGYKLQIEQAPLVLFFHGGSGVGKTHAANILATNILMGNKIDLCVHLFSVDLFLKSAKMTSKQNVYFEAIENWITGSHKDCCFSIFVFDELLANTPQELAQALGKVLSQLHTRQEPPPPSKNIIIVVMTMIGSRTISDFLATNIERGHDRDSLSVMKQNWQDPWRHLVINLEKLDQFRSWLPHGNYIRIPFLPLERSHVKQCAENSFRRKNMTVTEDRLDWVADQLAYFPNKLQIFSKSGCKKVSAKVDLILDGKIDSVNSLV